MDFTNPEQLAAEMASFANGEGGTIFIGVNDQGEAKGLDAEDVARINQLISNTASQGVKSPLVVQTENVPLESGRVVILLKVPKGFDKPYFDKNGVIWLRVGADKRRVNTKEELRRLFQVSDQFHGDELPTKAGIEALDKLRFRDFLRDKRGEEFPDDLGERLRLLQGMSLATEDGKLNLAGVLLFGERPQQYKPQFVTKAIHYPGTTVATLDYVDSEDFEGPLQSQYEGALAFIKRNLRNIQAGRGVNSPGTLEIPPVVFEELLVNALIHRDYLISAPIRIFVFDDRVEIISPGHLPDNLTVESILHRNPRHRNPILASYVAEGLLPYKGLGTGVPRAVASWPKIDFLDDRERDLFVATARRELITALGSEKGSEKSSERILNLLRQDGEATTTQLAEALGLSRRAVEKHIAALKIAGRLKRIGPDRGGKWEVVE
ncbi:MAG: putative DNA binding domain-containing protein [Fimbriimonadaceae bacterium]|nr:putative DNA binding domain-containing protein [Fimbriimonadaceae bacterium]